VYARGNRKEPIFRDDSDRWQYLGLFGLAALESGWRPLAYCLMGNHVHHLIELTAPNLGKGIGRVHGVYAQLFNKRHQTGGGHLFQRRYGVTYPRTPGAVIYIASYVLLNPVRAGLAEQPEDYPWSSYRATLDVKTAPPWLAARRLLELFGSERNLRQVVDAVRIMGSITTAP
jgi:putative transposase